jgi:hypothetical protein
MRWTIDDFAGRHRHVAEPRDEFADGRLNEPTVARDSPVAGAALGVSGWTLALDGHMF